MKNIFCALSALVIFSSCDKVTQAPVFPPEWQDPSPSVTEKRAFIWIEGNANFKDYGDSKANIKRDMEKIADCGFTDVVVDIRPAGAGGDVLFKTDKCPQVDFMGAYIDGVYTRVERSSDWDYLQAFIDEGHKAGLRVYAGFNTFCGGHKSGLGTNGVLYRDSKMLQHATMLNTANGIKSIMDEWADEKFLNPVHPDVQEYTLELLADLASYADLDGIILDRGRFHSAQSDFSDYTRAEFERYIGKTVKNWPDDVAPAGHEHFVPDPKPVHFMEWVEFRAKIIHDFIVTARNTVKSVNPEMDFGAYSGGWYEQYYDYGPNWASPTYPASIHFPDWATAKYNSYGFADHLDVQIIGAYASYNAVYGSTEWTMQGFCRLARQKTLNGPGIMIGGPDVGNWNWDGNATLNQELEAVSNSVSACADECDGYFMFDLCHLKLQPQKWDAVKKGLSKINFK